MNNDKKTTEGSPIHTDLSQAEKENTAEKAPAYADPDTDNKPTHEKVRTQEPEVTPEEAGPDEDRIDQLHADTYPGTTTATEKELPKITKK